MIRGCSSTSAVAPGPISISTRWTIPGSPEGVGWASVAEISSSSRRAPAPTRTFSVTWSPLSRVALLWARATRAAPSRPGSGRRASGEDPCRLVTTLRPPRSSTASSARLDSVSVLVDAARLVTVDVRYRRADIARGERAAPEVVELVADPARNRLGTIISEAEREERELAPVGAGSLEHDRDLGAHERRQVSLVDDQQVRARDPRSALAGHVVAAGAVEHEDLHVGQRRAEHRGQVVAAALDEHQVEGTVPGLEALHR